MANASTPRSKPAQEVTPGHLTVDGVVLSVEVVQGDVLIRHRHVTYVQRPDDLIVTFGRVSAEVLGAIHDSIAAEAA